MSGNLDLSVASALDDDTVAQIIGTAFDLNSILEELFKGSNVEDLVLSRARGVDDVFLGLLRTLAVLLLFARKRREFGGDISLLLHAIAQLLYFVAPSGHPSLLRASGQENQSFFPTELIPALPITLVHS